MVRIDDGGLLLGASLGGHSSAVSNWVEDSLVQTSAVPYSVHSSAV